MTTSTRRRGLATAATVALLAITGAACATSGGDSSDAGSAPEPASGQPGGGGTDGGAQRDAFQGEVAAEEAALDSVDTIGSAKTASTASGPDSPDAPEPGIQAAIINTGNVAMRSDDVGEALFDIGKTVDLYQGQIAQETTETDEKGAPLRSRMTLRVPAKNFAEAMESLEDVAILIASSSDSQDVTTTVLDKQARIAVQRRSIQRISVLLDRAVTIRDIVNIEAELSRRTAALASLERQARYLADQTSMSTITVSVERTKEKMPAPPPEEDDDKGFFAGLSTGWDAMVKFGVGLATVLGALLPWMIVVALLAIPILVLLRRQRRDGGATPLPPAPTEAAA